MRSRYYIVKPRRRSRIILGSFLIFAIVIVALIWIYASQPSNAHPILGIPFVSSAPDDAPSYGIAAGSSLTGLSKTALNARMAAIKASGARWVRFDIDWSIVQPTNAATYNWSTYDAIVNAAQQHGLYILAIIDYTPSWARLSSCASISNKCPPANPAAFGRYAAAAARHYNSKVYYWEVWNEPNNPQFWLPGADPQAYVALLKAAYEGIKGVNGQDYVITGGLSPQPNNTTAEAPINYLEALYADGAKGYFDAVGDHPYTFPLSPASDEDQAWAQMATDSDSLRNIMVQNGDSNKKIWITEFGAPTGGPGPVATLENPNLAAQPYVVDDALQAKILSDAITLYRTYNWAGPFFYYSYQDSGTDPSTNENFFGLVTYTGTPKAAYYVFKEAATGGTP